MAKFDYSYPRILKALDLNTDKAIYLPTEDQFAVFLEALEGSGCQIWVEETPWGWDKPIVHSQFYSKASKAI